MQDSRTKTNAWRKAVKIDRAMNGRGRRTGMIEAMTTIRTSSAKMLLKRRMLRETGFFGKEPVDVGGAKVRPVDLTSKLMFRIWQLGEGEEDLTIVRVTVEGEKGGKRVRYDYELLDRYDQTTNTTSMARTTGFTCTAAARLVAQGTYKRTGISPPEYLGRESTCHLFVMQELAKRGVVFRQSVT